MLTGTLFEQFYSCEDLVKIRAVTVGIAGLGGLGSNAALMLARSGIAKFVLADFDRVEASNLNRQAYFPCHIGRPKALCLTEILHELFEDLAIQPHVGELTKKNCLTVFNGCDIIIEAFDKAEAKAMLVNEFLGSQKLVVSASGLGGIGNSDAMVIRKVSENFYIIGDNASAVTPLVKPFAPRVTIAAAKQADVVLEWILSR